MYEPIVLEERGEKGGVLALFHAAQGAISGCLHRAQPYGSPKFMYFDGSVTWSLNISASLRRQTNAYVRTRLYKPNRTCPMEKRAAVGRFP